jgi:hypothetical protein
LIGLCSWANLPMNASKINDCSQNRVTKKSWEAVVLPLNYARISMT